MIETNRKRARELFARGVAAADPYAGVLRSLAAHPLNHTQPILILAVGKAARRMSEAALETYPNAEALIVTNAENAKPLAGATVLASGHPIPDQAGLDAANTMIKRITNAPHNAQILALISGGGSALLPAPVDGISLEDKIGLSHQLLASGADISQVNMIRQHLSRLKGGGLLSIANGRAVRSLILSDVIGDDLRVIASGPTTGPIGTSAQALDLIHTLNIQDKIAPQIRQHLETAQLSNTTTMAQNDLIGTNRQSISAMANGIDAHILANPVEGDVQDAAILICDSALSGVTLWGGETTVHLKGTGQGGRNQELALRIAIEAEKRNWPKGWVCLQAGTDGRDGPTDAAGGLVDSATLTRMRAVGINPETELANNNSYAALAAANDLLITGPTGTNVADLGILIRP